MDRTMSRCILYTGMILFLLAVAAKAEPLRAFRHAEYVDHPANDGDSFMVTMGGDVHMIRLYYVDCPETTTGTDADRRRALDQARYFGLEDPRRILYFGQVARARVGALLRTEPFTVYTSFASALGRSKKVRVYALVMLPDERMLDEILVGEGLARDRGVRRTLPDGTGPEERRARLQDLELAAAMDRRGTWAETEPRKLVAMRERQREEERTMAQEFGVFGKLSMERPIDLNHASPEELQELKGVGVALAERIVQHRPYTSVDDLLRVPGIGPETLKNARPFVIVDRE